MNTRAKSSPEFSLRPYEPEDAKIISSWLSNETVFYRWSFGKLGEYPISGEALRKYFVDGNIHLIAEDENGIAGHIMLSFPKEGVSHVRCGFIIVDSARRGTGCGHKLLTLTIEYAREVLKAEKLTLAVFEDNLPARRCYSAVGLRETGKRGEYIIKGEKWVALEMEISL